MTHVEIWFFDVLGNEDMYQFDMRVSMLDVIAIMDPFQ